MLRRLGRVPGGPCGSGRPAPGGRASGAVVPVVPGAAELPDPDWRHHVATVPASQAGPFYQRVCARLGEGTYQAPAAADPLIAWAQDHRSGLVAPSPVPLSTTAAPQGRAGAHSPHQLARHVPRTHDLPFTASSHHSAIFGSIE